MKKGSVHGCPNCGSISRGDYCAACGQEQRSLEVSFRSLIAEFGNEALGWFSEKLPRTLVLLLLHPGRLTAEYLSGRRRSYVRPMRLLAVALVLSLFVVRVGTSSERATGEELAASSRTLSERFQDAGETLQGLSRQLSEIGISEGQKRTYAYYEKLLVFALIPFLALLLRWFDRSRNRYLAEQMVFSVHLHVVGLLLDSLVEVAPLSPLPAGLGMGLGSFVYLALAMGEVHPETSRLGRWTRAAGIAVVYCLGLGLLGLAVVVAVLV